MKKMLVVSVAVAILLAGFGYANAQLFPATGITGPITGASHVAYKTGGGSTPGKIVTAKYKLTEPYLKFGQNDSGADRIYLSADITSTRHVILACTPQVIASDPPKGKKLTYGFQGFANCTFCPLSGVYSADACNSSGETVSRGNVSVSGTAHITSPTDQTVKKLNVQITATGGLFLYSTYDAIFTGNFAGVLKPE